MTLIVAFFAAIGGVAKALGFSGCLFAIVALVLFCLALKFVERADKVLERLQRRWRRLSKSAKWTIGFLAVVLFGPSLWAVVPKTAGAAAVVLALATVWYGQGWRHAKRYGLSDTTAWDAWNHHWDVSRRARGLTKAVGNATGKPNGRARRPVKTPTGTASVVEPPDGMSAQEFADLANEGGLHSATARQVGWDETKGMNATPLNDGTVLLHVDSENEDGGEPLEEERWWKP